MDTIELSAFEQMASDLLTWVGFGTVVGLVAKAIMPGRDPGGAIATLLMGIGGSVIGSGVLMYFWEGARVTPVSPLGFVVATVGAFALLAMYRIFGGRWFIEGERPRRAHFLNRPRRRRRYARARIPYYDGD